MSGTSKHLPRGEQSPAGGTPERRVFDTIVIGAGPAGTQCALVLRRLGADVLLIGDIPPSTRLSTMPREAGWAPNPVADEVSLRIANENADCVAGHGVHSLCGFASSVQREGPLLVSRTGQQAFRSRNVVLATGLGDGTLDISSIDLVLGDDGRIETYEGFQTSDIGIFAIGDLASGYDRSVSGAMGSGYRAAMAAWKDANERAAA